MNKVKVIESMNLLRVGFQGQGTVGEIQVTPTQTLDSFGHGNPHYFHMKRQQHYIHQYQLVLNYHLILVGRMIDRGIVRNRGPSQWNQGSRRVVEGCGGAWKGEGKRGGGERRNGQWE